MVKRLVAYLLLGALLFTVFGQVLAARTPVAVGIDVSSHQGRIDWDTTAKHIDFAILRSGYGRNVTTQDDTQWFNNADACTRLKIPFGAYLYSYATTEEALYSEIEHFLRLLDGYSPSLPVYLDLEYKGIARACTPEQILKHATIFCERMRKAGYTPGIYANVTWWNTYLNLPEYDQWERWVAHYTGTPTYSRSHSMWQYTNKGTIKGIQGSVDMDYWYGESPSVECSHSYSPQVITEPTCTAEGIRKQTCTKCGSSYQEKIPPKGHNYKSTVIPPTADTGGYTIYKCVCGSYYLGDETYPTTSEHVFGCPSAAYKDVPPLGHWAHEGIDRAFDDGLFQGVGDNRFLPEGVMTRAMLVTVLWRRDGNSQKVAPCNFVDVAPDAWYADAVAWAAQQGLVVGVGEGRFNPMGKISREQFATILYRRVAPSLQNDVPQDVLNVFPDKNQVSDYARAALSWAVHRGYITGTLVEGVLTLNPLGATTRAQAATIINRLPK